MEVGTLPGISARAAEPVADGRAGGKGPGDLLIEVG